MYLQVIIVTKNKNIRQKPCMVILDIEFQYKVIIIFKASNKLKQIQDKSVVISTSTGPFIL